MWETGEECSDDEDDERVWYGDRITYSDGSAEESDFDEEVVIALYGQVHHQHVDTPLTNGQDDRLSQDDTDPHTPQQSNDLKFSLSYLDDSCFSNKETDAEIEKHDESVYTIHSSPSSVEFLGITKSNVIEISSSSPYHRASDRENDVISVSSELTQDSRVLKAVQKDRTDSRPKTNTKQKKKPEKLKKEKWKPKQWLVVEDESSAEEGSVDRNSSNSGSDIELDSVIENMDCSSVLINATPSYRQSSKILDGKIEDTTLKEIHDDMPDNGWDLIPQDRMSLTPSRMRYYSPMTMQCRNCNEKGHTSKSCRKPKKALICCLCGDEGHLARSCPNRICYNCLQVGHDSKDCEQRRRSWHTQCFRCNANGHVKQECPDLWRQYHVTVTSSKVEWHDQKENSRVFCYNCAQKGHFGFDCEKPFMNRYTYPNVPFVTTYDGQRSKNEKDIPQKTRKRKHCAENEEDSKRPDKSTKKISKYSKSLLGKYRDAQKSGKSSKKRKMESENHDFPRTDPAESNSLESIDGENSRKRKRNKKNKKTGVNQTMNQSNDDEKEARRLKRKLKKKRKMRAKKMLKKQQMNTGQNKTGSVPQASPPNSAQKKTGNPKVKKKSKKKSNSDVSFVSARGFYSRFGSTSY